MQIPALDAIRSKRVGILNTQDATVLSVMHDEYEPPRNGGVEYRRSRPVFASTTNPVDYTSLITSPPKDSLLNLSDHSQATLEKIMDALRSENPSEYEFDLEVSDSEVPSFETEMLKRIFGRVSDGSCPRRIFNDIVKRANSGQLIDRQNDSFSSSKFTDQIYLPYKDSVSNWGFYLYNTEYQGDSLWSLWLRYERSDGSVEELPIFQHTKSNILLLSTSVDVGDGQPASDDLLAALEEQESESVSGVERSVADVAASATPSDVASEYLDVATNSDILAESE